MTVTDFRRAHETAILRPSHRFGFFDAKPISVGTRVWIVLLTAIGPFIPSVVFSADWNALADCLVSTQVTNPDLPAWTATMGKGPVNNWINAPFELIVLRRKWPARGDSASTVVLNQGDLNGGDVLREGFYDGATIRAYRMINGVFTKVRQDTVASGGHRASG